MTLPQDVDAALSRDMRRREFLVRKDAVPCTIMTMTNLIEGNLHKRGAYRIIDELNTVDQFIAVTNAKIYGGNSSEVIEADFITLRADQIIWVKPGTPATDPA
jgi:hypothetical protein